MPPRPREVLRVLELVGFEEGGKRVAIGFCAMPTDDKWLSRCTQESCRWAPSAPF